MDDSVGTTPLLREDPNSVLRISDRVFGAEHCAQLRYVAPVLKLRSEPGSDSFNIPGLHTVDSLGTLLTSVTGEFALGADIKLFSLAKFDAAGLFLHVGLHKLKFGVEEYGSNKKIVSVHSSPYSDEVNGIEVNDEPVRLFISRSGDVFSCYLSGSEGAVVFHRAFYVSNCPDEVRVGFSVQSPFSEGAVGEFSRIEISSQSMGLIRE
ncbi:DUF1349 domain-containing protein [Pseudomonas protegens]|uniref:DUF1349 domain-containing protein n=1 Tax=Pseudomonas protegens TaxID=380021 RepID=A0A9Q6IBB0_9PSED|nr:DUF1349 domain-containing protein [Pseudomonas protegens]PNG35779.1 hypothetical protein A1395_30900 [Pseudomonas protegens]PYC28973.1 DUF1349 domain-containing protein [Pseudomonas protegens]ROL90349.1 hypothetical protein BK639_20390 [Pseudomonas protegens]ROM03867.1 hypothetical protein BK642_19220 [Pseudomonas protegens]ROM05960.1 hypothetical protein BK641_14425 [Pseudomonas protegens]